MAGGYLEAFIADGFAAIVGEPTMLGIMLVSVFTVFVMLQGLRLDGKVAIIVPTCILAIVLIPWLAVLLGLGVGILIYLAIMLLTNK